MPGDIAVTGEHRVTFESKWTGWFGLAIVNILLTIITFGIYRFWARTRERRLLWSSTHFGGEALEYTGLGRELLIGAILAFFLLVLPLVVVGLVGAAARGYGLDWVAVVLQLASSAILLWLVQFAIWRALRYRLSRTRWSGIRGAMAGSAAAYALLAMKMLGLQIITLGFASPYASMRTFNARWSDARLGNIPFRAEGDWRPLQRLYFRSWAFGLAVLAVVAGIEWSLLGDYLFASAAVKAKIPPSVVGKAFALNLAWLLFVGLIMLRYFAAMWRAQIGGLSLDGLRFRFTASAGDWVRYWLGNAALVVFTLGIGGLMLRWRHWGFMAKHLEAEGALDVDRLRQTRIDAPLFGEGLADALDVGAI
ncbi:MAG: DUF898 family protein [Sphingomonadales bacterium]